MSIPSKSQTEFILKLRNFAIFISLLSLVTSVYLLTDRYDQLILQYKSELRDDFADDLCLFCNIYEVERENKQNEIFDKWNDTVIDDKIIDHWIKIKLSKMGQMNKVDYQIYYNTFDKKLIRQEIIDYNIKIEQEKENEKNRLEDDFQFEKLSKKIEKAVDKKVDEVGIINVFPASYLVGAFFGTLFFPVLFWCLWYFYKIKLE
jgi:hypothetical protein